MAAGNPGQRDGGGKLDMRANVCFKPRVLYVLLLLPPGLVSVCVATC